MQMAMERKPDLLGHICMMSDDFLVKTIMFGWMNGRSVRGRPHREWMDEVTD